MSLLDILFIIASIVIIILALRYNFTKDYTN